MGYTGGVNIADEYINEIEKFGHWKDTGVRLCFDGRGVKSGRAFLARLLHNRSDKTAYNFLNN